MTISTARRAGEERLVSATVVAVLALTIFRLVTLIESPLNLQFDEAQYWEWSRHVAFGYVSKPPLIAWIIAATSWLFGDGEAGIRAAAPLLHAATALALYNLGARLYGRLTGFWCAVTYATLPSVAYSSLIISTDACLLPFWALGLLAWWRLLERPSPGGAIALGVSIGLGLLAKYAMVYFLLGIAAHLVFSRPARAKLSRRHLGMALGIALILVSPNLLWNVTHGWATFSHTADNADWQGSRKGGPVATLAFLGGQFGIFGPILMAVALSIFVRIRKMNDARDVFLLAFSLPVLLLVTIQSLIAGAHLNWAAPAYVSLTVLVVAWCVARAAAWLFASMTLHLALTVLCCFCFAGFIPPQHIPHRLDIFAKLRGWDRMAEMIGSELRLYPGYSLLFDERKYAAIFNYYMRNSGHPIVIWPFFGRTHSQFALTNSIDAVTGAKSVLVSRWPEPNIEHQFANYKPLPVLQILFPSGEQRSFHLFACEGLKTVP